MTFGFVVPVYNMADSVGLSLTSVVSQVPAPDAVVVVDDGSTDNTAEIARSVLEAIPLTGRLLRLNGNRGVAAAINAGVALISTDWVQLMGADDLLTLNYLRAMHRAIKQVPDSVGVLSPRLEEFGDREGVWVGVVTGDRSFQPQPPVPGTSVVRRRAFVEAGGMDGRFDATGAEDWDLWCELHSRSWGFKSVPDAVYRYRVKGAKKYDQAGAHDRIRTLIQEKHPWTNASTSS